MNHKSGGGRELVACVFLLSLERQQRYSVAGSVAHPRSMEPHWTVATMLPFLALTVELVL